MYECSPPSLRGGEARRSSWTERRQSSMSVTSGFWQANAQVSLRRFQRVGFAWERIQTSCRGQTSCQSDTERATITGGRQSGFCTGILSDRSLACALHAGSVHNTARPRLVDTRWLPMDTWRFGLKPGTRTLGPAVHWIILPGVTEMKSETDKPRISNTYGTYAALVRGVGLS